MIKQVIKLTGCSLMIILLFNTVIHSEENNLNSSQPMSLEDVYRNMDYEDADTAIKKYEQKFNVDVVLPEKMPFKTTKKFGKIEKGKLNLAFIGDSRKKVFKIFVESSTKTMNETNYKLKNGQNVLIRQNEKVHKLTWLYLQKNKQKYTLSLNYFDEEIRKEKLIRSAESIN